LRRAAARSSSRKACSIQGAEWSYTDAAEAAARRAGTLRAAGIGRGDRVAVMCSNRAEMLEVFLACGWIGAVCVPINIASMGPQIDYYLTNSGAKLLVIEERFVERLATGVKKWVVGDASYPKVAEAIEAADVLPGD